MEKLEEEQKLFEEELRKYEDEKRRYEEEQRKILLQKIIAEEKQKELDEQERNKLSRRFIYDEDNTIYKNTNTKTFYTEYIQKKYTASTDTAFPTRKTETKVFGSDENEDYVYNTANTSFNSTTNININALTNVNTCAQCAALQNVNLGQNLVKNDGLKLVCPDCQMSENIKLNSVGQNQIITEQNLIQVQNSLCPGCGRMTDEHL